MLPAEVTKLTESFIAVFDAEHPRAIEFRGCRNSVARHYKGGIEFQSAAFVKIGRNVQDFVRGRAKFIWEKMQEAVRHTGTPFYADLSADLQSQLQSYMQLTMDKAGEFIREVRTETNTASGYETELLRELSNIIPKLNAEIDLFCAEYRMNEKRKNESQGPTIIYNLHGANPRVNVNSIDQSVNVTNVSKPTLFANLREQLNGIEDEELRASLLKKTSELENEAGKPSYVQRYAEFVALAANCMTLVAPFIPALTQLLPS